MGHQFCFLREFLRCPFGEPTKSQDFFFKVDSAHPLGRKNQSFFCVSIPSIYLNLLFFNLIQSLTLILLVFVGIPAYYLLSTQLNQMRKGDELVTSSSLLSPHLPIKSSRSSQIRITGRIVIIIRKIKRRSIRIAASISISISISSSSSSSTTASRSPSCYDKTWLHHINEFSFNHKTHSIFIYLIKYLGNCNQTEKEYYPKI